MEQRERLLMEQREPLLFKSKVAYRETCSWRGDNRYFLKVKLRIVNARDTKKSKNVFLEYETEKNEL